MEIFTNFSLCLCACVHVNHTFSLSGYFIYHLPWEMGGKFKRKGHM